MNHASLIAAFAAAAITLSAGVATAQDADYIHDKDFVYVGSHTYNQNVFATYVDRSSIEPGDKGSFSVTLFSVYNSSAPATAERTAKYGLTWAVVYCRDGYIRNFSAKDFAADNTFFAHYGLRTDPVQMTADAADKPAFDYVCMSDDQRAAAGYWSSKTAGIDPISDADSRYKAAATPRPAAQ